MADCSRCRWSGSSLCSRTSGKVECWAYDEGDRSEIPSSRIVKYDVKVYVKGYAKSTQCGERKDDLLLAYLPRGRRAGAKTRPRGQTALPVSGT